MEVPQGIEPSSARLQRAACATLLWDRELVAPKGLIERELTLGEEPRARRHLLGVVLGPLGQALAAGGDAVVLAIVSAHEHRTEDGAEDGRDTFDRQLGEQVRRVG